MTGTSATAATISFGCSHHRTCIEHLEHAFLDSGGTLTDLGTLGGNFSYGTAINTSGQVAGCSSAASGENQAFLYSGGKMTDLGTLGGPEQLRRCHQQRRPGRRERRDEQ